MGGIVCVSVSGGGGRKGGRDSGIVSSFLSTLALPIGQPCFSDVLCRVLNIAITVPLIVAKLPFLHKVRFCHSIGTCAVSVPF